MFQTARLLLRPVQPEDNEAIFVYRSDATTNRYQSSLPSSIEEVDALIQSNPREFNISKTWYQLAIIEKSSGSLIGDIGVHFIDNAQCEFGCTLAKKYHRKGYATEALQSLIEHLFSILDKHRITASIDPRNVGSIQLFERLGFRKEGYFIQSLYINGEWVDDLIYAVLASEWRERNLD